MVKELNWLYRREPALFEVDDSYQGFEWIDLQDSESSIITFIRFARNREDFIVFACNFTPVPREGYRIGVPKAGLYRELFNTDSELFGGANLGNAGAVWADEIPFHGRRRQLECDAFRRWRWWRLSFRQIPKAVRWTFENRYYRFAFFWRVSPQRKQRESRTLPTCPPPTMPWRRCSSSPMLRVPTRSTI